MTYSVCYVERQPESFVSLERSFREIAANLSPKYSSFFRQVPFSSKVVEVPRNLAFIKREPADIYHVTGHVNYIALRFPPEQTVLSIMDVRFVNMNSGVRRAILKKLYLDLPVRHLRYITAISENVKQEIIDLTRCSPDKIRVLDLPLFSHFAPTEFAETTNSKPVVLQVGTMVNKNVVRLAEALRGLDCKLIVVGRLDQDQRLALENNKIDFENPVGITDQEMRDTYLNSDIVTFCSTYEGFGLPIIEAQALRKPVVTSNISPMKETAGNGAILVDPFDVESMRTGISSLLENREARMKIVELGVANADRFSPSRVAAQYETLYDEIIATLA